MTCHWSMTVLKTSGQGAWASNSSVFFGTRNARAALRPAMVCQRWFPGQWQALAWLEPITMYLEIPTCGIWYHATCSISMWYHRYMANTIKIPILVLTFASSCRMSLANNGQGEGGLRNLEGGDVVDVLWHEILIRILHVDRASLELKNCSIPQVENTLSFGCKRAVFSSFQWPCNTPSVVAHQLHNLRSKAPGLPKIPSKGISTKG